MIASEPPQPPQKHARSFGLIGISGDGSPNPMPWRSPMPSTRSTPLHCSSNTTSMPFGDSSRTPLASPPHAIGAWIRATERALPWPPAAGISARRHGIVADTSASSGGLISVRKAIELWSTPSTVSGALGGMTWAMRASCSAAVPMWKSAPSGPVISLATNSPIVCPVTRRTTSPTR